MKREREAPAIWVDNSYMHSEQEKVKEKGMPSLVLKDGRTYTTTAKIVQSKGVTGLVVGTMKMTVEQLRYKKKPLIRP